MNKKMVLVAAWLVNMVTAVFGTDFEERILERIWLRDYFNEVIYVQDRNIIVNYQPGCKEKTYVYDAVSDSMIFWYQALYAFWDDVECTSPEDDMYANRIWIGAGFDYRVNEINPDLYEVQIEDVRISQERYESLLEDGHNMKFALDATEPEYSLYFRFDGEYLYISGRRKNIVYNILCL